MPGRLERREFITLLGGAAACPLAAGAQQSPKSHRIAVVHPSAPVAQMSETSGLPVSALFKELHRLGYVEGRLIIERYSGAGQEERFDELARDVVRSKPDLIVSSTARLLRSFKAATSSIPVVALTADPVAFVIVTSLAHPGGNITGVAVDAGIELWGKHLQILREAVPTASRVGFLASRTVWDLAQGTPLVDAARKSGVTLLGPPLESPIDQEEYRRVLLAMAQSRAEALVVSDQAENVSYQRTIVGLAEETRLPAVYPYSSFTKIGGLMAYGTDLADVYRRMAGYVDQILKGAAPGELPFYLASKFELAINLKTAKALGITFPTALLVRADAVVE
jgi:putative ABC transport system substrate-binding protein